MNLIMNDYKKSFVNESYYKKLFLQKFHNKTSTFESKPL